VASAASAEIRLGLLLAVLSMVLMALGIVIAKPVLNRANAWWAAWVRVAGGTALLVVQVGLSRSRARSVRLLCPGRGWLLLMPTALIGGFLSMILWILGMKHTQTSIASVLNQLSALFTLPLAALLLREPLTWRRVVAVLLGITGAVMVAR
jgi:drug/metabolite transporter (DMT)-like permease